MQYVREAEVSDTLSYDMDLGRVWSQTVAPETHHKTVQQYEVTPAGHRSPTVCHTPVACSQYHPLTHPPPIPHVCMGCRTRAATSRLTERLLSSFILWRLQHWILESQQTMKPLFSKHNQHTVHLDTHAYSHKHSHHVHMHIQWLWETSSINVQYWRYIQMIYSLGWWAWVLFASYTPSNFIHLLCVLYKHRWLQAA